jgi:uncharacterized repeat protein (TIGR03803 family)
MASALGAIGSFSAHASTFTTLAALPGDPDGAMPQSALLYYGGRLYGVCPNGGTYGSGIVYELNPNTGTSKVVHTFHLASEGAAPMAALVEANGLLYGSAFSGGNAFAYTIFSFDPKTHSTKTVYIFPTNPGGTPVSPPSSLIYVNGLLYGTTPYGGASNNGQVYSIDPTTGAETTIYSFAGAPDGATPLSELTAVGGTLLGTTSAGGAYGRGTIYSIDISTGQEKGLYSISIGSAPSGGLVNVNGTLYGTTRGVLGGYGTVFSYNPSTGSFSTMYSFAGGADASGPQSTLLYVNGALYGSAPGGGATGNGAVFEVNPSTGAEQVTYSFTDGADGSAPVGGLIAIGSEIYGTASYAGQFGDGSVFKINAATNALSNLHAFTGYAYGAENTLANVAGSLYGTTPQGGLYHGGSVYTINPTTGALNTAYSFAGGAAGYQPQSPVSGFGSEVLGLAKGSLVGGLAFAVNTGNGSETTLHNFPVGSAAYAGSLIAAGSQVFGVTHSGGEAHSGTIFQIDPQTGATKQIYAFRGKKDGGAVSTPLIDVGGTLYGGTSQGGNFNRGTLFAFNPSTLKVTTLYSFGTAANDGQSPFGALAQVNGFLYGVTEFGGPSGFGAMFRIDPTSGDETVYPFTIAAGPTGGLAVLGDEIYGSLAGNGYPDGALYSFNPQRATFKVVHSFTKAKDGAGVYQAPVVLNGSLYGVTQFGGHFQGGTVFAFTP